MISRSPVLRFVKFSTLLCTGRVVGLATAGIGVADINVIIAKSCKKSGIGELRCWLVVNIVISAISDERVDAAVCPSNSIDCWL